MIKKNVIDMGFGGWMADFAEYIPADAIFSNGKTGEMVKRFSKKKTKKRKYPIIATLM